MDFRSYYLTIPPANRAEFARRVGTTALYLRNIAYGFRQANGSLALAIERETAGAVTVADLRPDLAAAMEAAGYTRAEPTPGIPSRHQPSTTEAA